MCFQDTIHFSFEKYDPSILEKYLLQVCRAFNSYYTKVKILNEDVYLSSRLYLVQCTANVLKEGLGILGIQTPKKCKFL
ncbi:DALR anticodon-binding domain-containing protein [Bacillus sp. UMB0893]|uniref:DALR anticodon-binding domain-containing protein n=1 Tax=Bacillus sp. UMB0893 TaxID=2066053 RepID=UPI000C769EC7|nr:hypothetical protein CYJ36_07830 [Bacillus sp. UMB0893]